MRYIHNILSASRILATLPCAILAAFDETRPVALAMAVLVALTDWAE